MQISSCRCIDALFHGLLVLLHGIAFELFTIKHGGEVVPSIFMNLRWVFFFDGPNLAYTLDINDQRVITDFVLAHFFFKSPFSGHWRLLCEAA